MLSVRPAETQDLPVIWALSVLLNVGYTADTSVLFPLPPAQSIPAEAFSDLDDPDSTFVALGGDYWLRNWTAASQRWAASARQ